MRIIVLTVCIACFVFTAAGCVFISVGSGNARTEVIQAMPTYVISHSHDDTAIMAEIDAAAGLDFDSARVKHLRAIAMREALSVSVQVYLVDTAYARLDFDSSAQAVLTALIRNLWFCTPAKAQILKRMHELDFSSTREALLEEMNRRPVLPAVAQPGEIAPK